MSARRMAPRFACETRPPWDFTPDRCCKRQAIATMDFFHRHLDRREEPEQYVRRVCVKCLTRWEGVVSAVKKFTAKEWQIYLQNLTP